MLLVYSGVVLAVIAANVVTILLAAIIASRRMRHRLHYSVGFSGRVALNVAKLPALLPCK